MLLFIYEIRPKQFREFRDVVFEDVVFDSNSSVTQM